jgi:predicted nucleic acid-binding protein
MIAPPVDRIYLDMCCFKRPFDDQRQPRIRREAEAVSIIIEQAERVRVALIRSPALLLENEANPREDRRVAAALWIDGAAVEVAHSPEVERRAEDLSALGFAPLDALHVSYAEAAGARALLTCDDGLLGLGRQHGGLLQTMIKNPVDFQQELVT